MMNNDPESDPKLFAGKTRLWYGRWDYKYLMAAKKGAAGAIIIHTTPSAGYPLAGRAELLGRASSSSCPTTARRASRSGRGPTEELSRADREARRPGPRRAARVGGDPRRSGRCRSASGCPSPSRTRSSRRSRATSSAGCPGGDPKLSRRGGRLHRPPRPLRDQARAPARARTTIYNGAHRQRSPASPRCSPWREALRGRCPQPRAARSTSPSWRARSRGCSAPQYFAQHPPVPAGKIAANINIDEANWFGPHARHLDDRPRQVLARRDVIARGRRRRGAWSKPDEFPDRGRLLPLRPVQLREGRRARRVLRSSAPTSSASPRATGKEQRRGLREDHDYHQPSDELPRHLGLRGRGRGLPARLPARLPRRRRRRHAPLEQGRRVRGGAIEGAWPNRRTRPKVGQGHDTRRDVQRSWAWRPLAGARAASRDASRVPLPRRPLRHGRWSSRGALKPGDTVGLITPSSYVFDYVADRPRGGAARGDARREMQARAGS